MLQYLANNVEVLNALLNGLLVVIWAVYLQLFLVNHLRMARSVIHIDIGAAEGERSRCLVTNLGSNPLYVQGIAADFAGNELTARTVITERDEIDENDLEDPLSRTNRGTLQPGQTVDIGSLADMVRRAQIRLQQDWSADQLKHVTITVVALSGQVERVVGRQQDVRLAAHERAHPLCRAKHADASDPLAAHPRQVHRGAARPSRQVSLERA